MKRFIKVLLISFISIAATSCMPSDEEELQEVVIDKTLIVGHWVDDNTEEHWRYNSNGEGVYWDPAEMTEEDAAAGAGKFQYSFNNTGLMRIFWMETTGSYSNPDTEAPYVIDLLERNKMMYHSSRTTRYHYFTKQ